MMPRLEPVPVEEDRLDGCARRGRSPRARTAECSLTGTRHGKDSNGAAHTGEANTLVGRVNDHRRGVSPAAAHAAMPLQDQPHRVPDDEGTRGVPDAAALASTLAGSGNSPSAGTARLARQVADTSGIGDSSSWHCHRVHPHAGTAAQRSPRAPGRARPVVATRRVPVTTTTRRTSSGRRRHR